MTNHSINRAIHKLANIVISICNSSTSVNLGLLRGKLGAVIFLLHYARYYNIEKYESCAIEFLEYIQDNLIIRDNINVINHNLIDIGIGMNYMVNQELGSGDLDEILEDIDNFLLSYLDNKNILFLTNLDLTDIGKYFLLRMDAAPSSINHLHHIKALESIVEVLKLHISHIPICNPFIVKFLYFSSKVLSDKSIELLLIQQLNNCPNQKNWYRYGIPNWFSTFFIPEDNEPLKNIIIKEIGKYSWKCLDNNWFDDTLGDGAAGLIVWMNLLTNDLSAEKCSVIKNAAIEKIVSNVNNYEVPKGVSLYFGCSGIGLALLSCIDNKCTQWIKLL